MVEFFLSGGVVMVPVLIVGLLTVVAGARGSTKRLVALTVALTALGVGSTAFDMVVALQTVAAQPAQHAQMAMVGIAESFSPIVLACGLVTVAWLCAGARSPSSRSKHAPTPGQLRNAVDPA